MAKAVLTLLHIAYAADDQPKPFRHEREDEAALRAWDQDNVTTKRGWCLQEHILSRRTVHFGAQQVYWERHEQHASETNQKTIYHDAQRFVREESRLWKPLIGVREIPLDLGTYQSLFYKWYTMLSTYTQCNLTYPSDKLVAISGLANEMNSALRLYIHEKHHYYIAGLWAEDLRMGLCWHRTEGGIRPHSYRAPSWSWLQWTAWQCGIGILLGLL